MMRLTELAATEKFLPKGVEHSSAALRRGKAVRRGNSLEKLGGERFIFLARSRRTAQRLGSENLFPVGAVFRSAKNHVAMSLRFERDELGNDFILSISEEVGVIHKTEMLLVGLALGNNPEKFRLKLFTRLAGDKKDAV
jgi:hypothetical protein